jgi:hypothetical protein
MHRCYCLQIDGNTPPDIYEAAEVMAPQMFICQHSVNEQGHRAGASLMKVDPS